MKHPIFKTTGVVLLAATVMSFSTVQTAEAKQWDMCSWDEIPQSVLNRIIRRPDYEDILRRMFVHCPDAALTLSDRLRANGPERGFERNDTQNQVERVSFDAANPTTAPGGDAAGGTSSRGATGSDGPESSSSGDSSASGGGSSSGDGNASGGGGNSSSSGGQGSNANNGGGNGSEGSSPGKGKGANNDE
ncbi:MAG: hypothetical protein V2I76_06035 [Roseobacter sp.]|jgi:uncharacterized membrane protein YgcG|nr:hypothetical protein [Roseobacter sp.]